MKLWKRVFILTLCLLLTACAPAAETPESPARTEGPAAPADPAGVPPSLAEDEEPTVLTCRVVDGAEDGNLLLAELDEGLYGGTGVYRLNVKDVPVTLDGEAAEPSVLEDGMAVDVAFNGHVLESFPSQLGEVYSVSAWSRGRGRNGGGTMFDLCGLYLQVLDDLWKKDPALNGDVSQIALDLSQAPGELTEGEKPALVHRFGELHGVEAFAATFEELEEQGYLTSEPLGNGAPEGTAFVRWEDGCLFSITPSEDHEGESYSLPTLFFNAEKWRSSLGAYGFYDCSAGWGQVSTWNGYQIGSEMIS
jgi:hypothetical protein